MFPPNPKPYISISLPFQKACAHHVTNTFHASKVYVIVSTSISKTENFANLRSELQGKIVGVRYGIKPHTPWIDVLEIVNDIRQKEADLIVTLGAGSLTDGAKIISFALANQAFTLESLARLPAPMKTPDLQPCQLPIINIPTSLSGGEYTSTGGATDIRTHQKHSFAHASMGARLVILDPVLSISTPERIWLSTGMRAVDHCVEGLCSTSLNSSGVTDAAYSKGESGSSLERDARCYRVFERQQSWSSYGRFSCHRSSARASRCGAWRDKLCHVASRTQVQLQIRRSESEGIAAESFGCVLG